MDFNFDPYMTLIILIVSGFAGGFGSALGIELAKYLISILKARRQKIGELLSKKI
jgi:hypothetical protein